MPSWRVALKSVGYLLYLLLFLLGANYAFYRVYRSKLEKTVAPINVAFQTYDGTIEAEIANRLGRLNFDKRSSFVHFPRNKRPGTVRVGCFGDSFTYGEEVDDSHDFPSLLQRLYLEHGRPNVEVLNFGHGWYGFHQTYMAWESLGTRFDLDTVILGPSTFYAGRDLTFNHAREGAPFYIHSRYILANGDVRRIDIPATNYEEKFRAYYAFIPSLDIWRYDRNPPPFLAALLPRGRTIPNPFYYLESDPETEALATYSILLRKMAEKTPIILGNYETKIVDLARALGNDKLTVALLRRFTTFPYRTAKGHNSPAGNELVARQYFDLLESRPESRGEILTTHDIPWPSRKAKLRAEVKLPQVEEMRLYLARKFIGYLAPLDDDAQKRVEEPVSLLAVGSARGSTVLESDFLHVPFALREGMAVVSRGKNKNKRTGTIELLHPQVPIGRIRWNEPSPTAPTAAIEVDGRKVEVDDSSLVIYPLGDRLPDIRAFAKNEPVDLELLSDDSSFVLPFAEVSKQTESQ